MKKLAITLCMMSVLAGYAAAAENQNIPPERKQPPTKEQMEQFRKAHEFAFDQKLGLTEVQKLKAKQLRQSGHAKMDPVMKQIFAKKQEAEAIRNSKIAQQAQEEKLTQIDKDLTALKKQADQIRKQNMKEFESILTREQKNTLKNMKKEGRKNFKRNKGLIKPPCPPPQFEFKK